MPILLAILTFVVGPLYAPERAVREGPVSVDPPALEGPCSEWAGAAIDAGWGTDQWPRLAEIMWCESRCDAGAHNASGASGLLQIMPMWWHGRDAFDPAVNLAIGLEVYNAQGWHAWQCA
jgi:hypothetical protein